MKSEMGTQRTIKELSASLDAGSASPVELLEKSLEAAERTRKSLNCFISVLEDSARESAKQAQARARAGNRIGPLDGVPFAVKDLFYIEGVKCTAGSKILANNVAGYDAPVVRRLKAAGAVIIGTTNMHEFAAGVTNENPHFGPVRNPWDERRMSGGSSGGSAAAVASGIVPASLGTDTAGSVRIPAALCGVIGMKPTYGRISRLGVIPLAPSFDTVGTLTTSAWDAAALLRVLAGHDPEDITTVPSDVPDYVADLGGEVRGIRVGIPEHYFQETLDPGVEGKFKDFIVSLGDMGCEIMDVEFEGIDEVYDKWLPIRRAEATAFHLKWLDTYPELYGDDVRKLLELGRNVSAVEYVGAQNARPVLMERFIVSMKGVDVIATPTTSVTAPILGTTSVKIAGKDVDIYSALNRLTLPFNLVGFPAISVPAGTSKGLPVGAQLIAKPFEESALLKLVNAIEAASGHFDAPRN